MYSSQDIHAIHLEITSKCNAKCPMCLRNVLGGKVNPYLPLTELSLEEIKKIFPDNFISKLKRMYMCGNYGDPVVARDTLEVFRHFRAINEKMDLEMFTNGSARTVEWWQELAKVITHCRFGVDGLGDTNAIYRRGTQWDLILRNMRTFIAAGGQVIWDFIVFKHNEHQVEEAREFAKSLGVKKFNVKKTARFFSNIDVAVKNKQEVRKASGELEYYLEPPTEVQFQNSAHHKEAEIISKFGSLKNFFEKTSIDCKVSRERSVYVSAQGLAFPCCWTANQLYPWYYPRRGSAIWKMIDDLPGGLDALNAIEKGIVSVIESGFFQSVLPSSWQPENTEKRLFVCGKICGKGYDAFQAQFMEKRA